MIKKLNKSHDKKSYRQTNKKASGNLQIEGGAWGGRKGCQPFLPPFKKNNE
jgi:hypothetical protein